MVQTKAHLPYNPQKIARENTRFYISSTKEDQEQMLAAIGKKKRDELFSHIPPSTLIKENMGLGHPLEYQELADHMLAVSLKNNIRKSFLGDALPAYKVPSIIPYLCELRGLTTAYTPYQPERSQGTLQTLWIYANTLSMLTGFEAINASLYDRSTALFEAIKTAQRLVKNTTVALIPEGIFPQDLEVLVTLAKETELQLITVSTDSKTGTISFEELKKIHEKYNATVAALVIPQINSLGLMEDVHTLTDWGKDHNVQTIGIIDPMLLATGGLTPPSQWGKQGVNMIVGEGQHFAIGPNFGGPGLGIFGIRFNNDNKNDIRSTAGRFVGKTLDRKGREALCMVLSTREQHIRREKATSNICSNQSFVATLAGAGILARGESGLKESVSLGRQRALKVAKELLELDGIQLLHSETPFWNEISFAINTDIQKLLQLGREKNMWIGHDISNRAQKSNVLKISFTDWQTDQDVDDLVAFFKDQFSKGSSKTIPLPSTNLLRSTPTQFPQFNEAELKEFYQKLADQNVSPDDNIYPLGSCTMKFNPHINDWAASLEGFTDIHPQAPLEDAQGCLHVLYETQEMFKKITGLAAVTTQPVAGAQGELVGLKLFQAYHRHNGNSEVKNVVLIPRSAHGTNPATASMAGFETKMVNGQAIGIVSIDALPNGEINFDQFKTLIEKYGKNIAGMMVTNPNTSGIFETKFKEMADLIHSVDGLVYMDGANMNAIAGIVNLDKLGVDAVHNNLHKTWTIPHGGGGPGDAIVAVSHKLVDFLPGHQVELKDDTYSVVRAKHTIGSFHRHWGNFAHKVRCYTYIKALGDEGVKTMSSIAVLSAVYLYQKLKGTFPSLPAGGSESPRMHEFIITLEKEMFDGIEKSGTPKVQSIAKIGKLFLDFGLHAPTVAFPEQFGLMIEPTESYSKAELDRFIDIITAIKKILIDHPEVLMTAPHFTPIDKVDEVEANKNLILSEKITRLPEVIPNRIDPGPLKTMAVGDICMKIIEAHKVQG